MTRIFEPKPVTLSRTSCWNPVTTAIVIKLTTTASAILNMEMRTMGLETFLPSTSLFRILCDMKYSNGKRLVLNARKYIKHLCLKSILILLVTSCGLHKPKRTVITETQVIEQFDPGDADSIRVEEQQVHNRLRAPVLGIDRLHLFMDSLQNKNIAVVSNQTSMVGNVHLLDTLLSLGLNVQKVFAPEHGFRGQADAGERVHSSVDEKTGIPLISLYGQNKKPLPSEMANIDIVIYDIQDVGVRFYTFISTLHYVMEACAENNKQVVVLDRPNPNGHYVDGPVLEKEFKSFVGMHPVPIVYGMTIGEYAMMINGEGWLNNGIRCNLWVIPCKNYKHKLKYTLPVAPSPNLRTDGAIALYPSLCLFEATTVSIGRGTDKPFEFYGHPRFPKMDFFFTPIPTPGAKTPPQMNRLCFGYDLSSGSSKRSYEINLNYLIQARDLLGDSAVFIDQNGFFNRLAGTATLKEQLYKGWSSKEIRETWKPGLDAFMITRKKYLLYE